MAGRHLSSLFDDLRRLTLGKSLQTIAEESKINAETLKPWLRAGYVPNRKPPKENYERLVAYVKGLQDRVTTGDGASRETAASNGRADVVRQIDAIRAVSMPEGMKVLEIEAVAAAYRAYALAAEVDVARERALEVKRAGEEATLRQAAQLREQERQRQRGEATDRPGEATG